MEMEELSGANLVSQIYVIRETALKNPAVAAAAVVMVLLLFLAQETGRHLHSHLKSIS